MSLANGIVLHEEKNLKAYDTCIGKDLLGNIIGEESVKMLIGQRKEQLRINVAKKGRSRPRMVRRRTLATATSKFSALEYMYVVGGYDKK